MSPWISLKDLAISIRNSPKDLVISACKSPISFRIITRANDREKTPTAVNTNCGSNSYMIQSSPFQETMTISGIMAHNSQISSHFEAKVKKYFLLDSPPHRQSQSESCQGRVPPSVLRRGTVFDKTRRRHLSKTGEGRRLF